MKLGYKGFTHPMSDEEVVPTLQMLIRNALEHIELHPESINTENVVGFLKQLLDCSVPEKGYFYCPYIPYMDGPILLPESAVHQEILKKYGKKIMGKDSN